MKDIIELDPIKNLDLTSRELVKEIKNCLIKHYPGKSKQYEQIPVCFIHDFIAGNHQYVPAIEAFLQEQIPSFNFMDPYQITDDQDIDIDQLEKIDSINNMIIIVPTKINHGFEAEENDKKNINYFVGKNNYKLIMASVHRIEINHMYYSFFKTVENKTEEDTEIDILYSDFDDYALPGKNGLKTLNCFITEFKITKKFIQ